MARMLTERKKMPKHPYMVKSIVTTTLQDAICQKYGVEMFDTLTGFKWLCGKMREMEQNHPEKSFLFATEESFGYLTHDEVRDKDGIAPLAVIAEMALTYQQNNMDLIDALDELYTEFGFYHESQLSLDYFGIEGADKIIRIMQSFRKNPPKEILGEKIKTIEDYEPGFKGLPSSDVLAFEFAAGHKLFLRPSGTEPKIKFYLMLIEKNGTLAENKVKAATKSEHFIKWIREYCEKI